MNGRGKFGGVALALLAAAPLALALVLRPWDGPVSGAAALELLGRGAAILGLACLLLAAVTSLRIPRVDACFGGLTRQWQAHHILGAAAFLLLMAHPLLQAFGAARISLQAASAVLFPRGAAWSLWAGWLALAAMALFLAPTFWFFGQPDFRRWKFAHALSGPAVLLGLAHAAASGGLLPGGRGKAVWSAYGAAALLAFAYRLLAARRVGRKGCTIVRVDAVARGIVELTLKPDGAVPDYRAGQFIYLTPMSSELAEGRGEEHPYTLSSASHEAALRVVIKDLGDATHALQTVPAGSRAFVEGPYGDFFGGGATRELWIAGGIGLTPFLSRARGLAAGGAGDISLIYCVQDETRAHFLAELEAVAARNGGFRLFTHYFGREGALSAAFLASRCPDFAEREIYVCGPPPLIETARAELRRAGVSSARIHSEDFNWI